ncbi:MAG TPA: ABC transporter substrate-binding protein, partial [Limnobacter sp.]|nr:ABC transporter substrate-binding protein [Limnobacter sp.]
LRRWLAANEIDVSQDARIEVVPPVRMVQALKAGRIDAFCVGEPYNTQAVEQGLGAIVATGQDLWPHAPEKVLGCTSAWAESNPQALQGFVRAVGLACQWLQGGLENRRQAAAWLSASDHVNLPPALLEKALLAQAENDQGPFIQFDGKPADHGQLNLFQALALETHGLVSNQPPTAEELLCSLKPFGFQAFASGRQAD